VTPTYPITQPSAITQSGVALKMWLQGDTPTSSPVTTWSDSSGTSHNGTCTSPTWASNQINGHAALTFNGSSQWCTISLTTAQTTNSIFIVLKPTTPSAEEVYVSNTANSEMFLQNTGFLQYIGATGNPSQSALTTNWQLVEGHM